MTKMMMTSGGEDTYHFGQLLYRSYTCFVIDMASTMKFCDVCGKTCETAKICLECKKKHSKDTYQ